MKEKALPWYRQVEERKSYLILHFFSGRRREGDFHDAIKSLAAAARCPFDIHVISMDTAVDSSYGDLSAGGQAWDKAKGLILSGQVAGAIAGPPCETYTEARHWLPEGITAEEASKWPRPLRSAAHSWGVEQLRPKELRQLKQGSMFVGQMLWAMVAIWINGGTMLIEHPAPPKKEERASVRFLLGLADSSYRRTGVDCQSSRLAFWLHVLRDFGSR